MIFYKNLTERCTSKRKESGLSVEELAARTGLEPRIIEEFESGSSKITVEDFFKILDALGIELKAAAI